MFELSFIWAGIIAFAVLTYVLLDGFDLGVGILFPFAKNEQDKATMMNSIAPIWMAMKHGLFWEEGDYLQFSHLPTLS